MSRLVVSFPVSAEMSNWAFVIFVFFAYVIYILPAHLRNYYGYHWIASTRHATALSRTWNGVWRMRFRFIVLVVCKVQFFNWYWKIILLQTVVCARALNLVSCRMAPACLRASPPVEWHAVCILQIIIFMRFCDIEFNAMLNMAGPTRHIFNHSYRCILYTLRVTARPFHIF